MAPSTMNHPRASRRTLSVSLNRSKPAQNVKKYLLNRSTNAVGFRVKEGRGNYYVLDDGTEIYDASGGAAVATLGKYNERVMNVLTKTMRKGLTYVPSLAFDTKVAEELSEYLISSTGGSFKKAVFYGSGSEASEAAIKMIYQYHAKEKSPPEPGRTIIIARETSYHGATLGALDTSGHEARKSLYQSILSGNMRTIPACNPYRNRQPGQTDEQYIQWHKDQLVARIEAEGRSKVAALFIEPVVGAALGCAPAVPGYLKAMRDVCDQYGIVLVFDEVMCGLGRTGYIHAWQAENVVPDIQLLGKALAAGFQPISAMLVSPKIIDAFEKGPSNGAFNHGHTFQNYPPACAVALEVQRIIRDENIMENVRNKGSILQKKLRSRLQNHRYVGDIRGPAEGLFIGIEFVQNKDSKQPFERTDEISAKIFARGFTKPYCIHVYPGAGSVDGICGDHILLAPAYNITDAEVDLITQRVVQLIEDFFDEYDAIHAKVP